MMSRARSSNFCLGCGPGAHLTWTFSYSILVLYGLSASSGWPSAGCLGVNKGRTFQCGEGWHRNENAVRLWIPSPRVPKETDARCDACTKAYAKMIPGCNVC